MSRTTAAGRGSNTAARVRTCLRIPRDQYAAVMKGLARDQPRPEVLVLDGDNRAAMALTRSLGEQGLCIAVAGPVGALAFRSRYAAVRIVHGPKKTDPDLYACVLADAVDAHRPGAILASDKSVAAVRSVLGRVARVAALALPSEQRLATAISKAATLSPRR